MNDLIAEFQLTIPNFDTDKIDAIIATTNDKNIQQDMIMEYANKLLDGVQLDVMPVGYCHDKNYDGDCDYENKKCNNCGYKWE